MVRLKGVEPLTSWSVARRSIQLSYRRTVRDNLLDPGCGNKILRSRGLLLFNLLFVGIPTIENHPRVEVVPNHIFRDQ